MHVTKSNGRQVVSEACEMGGEKMFGGDVHFIPSSAIWHVTRSKIPRLDGRLGGKGVFGESREIGGSGNRESGS